MAFESDNSSSIVYHFVDAVNESTIMTINAWSTQLIDSIHLVLCGMGNIGICRLLIGTLLHKVSTCYATTQGPCLGMRILLLRTLYCWYCWY